MVYNWKLYYFEISVSDIFSGGMILTNNSPKNIIWEEKQLKDEFRVLS